MYQLYSQSGCIFECKMRLGKTKTLGACTPWFYPSPDTNMCDPWQTQIFLSAVLDGGAAKTCGHCLPDCESVTLDITQNRPESRHTDLS